MLQLSLRKVPTEAERFLASYEGEAGKAGKPSILPRLLSQIAKIVGIWEGTGF